MPHFLEYLPLVGGELSHSDGCPSQDNSDGTHVVTANEGRQVVELSTTGNSGSYTHSPAVIPVLAGRDSLVRFRHPGSDTRTSLPVTLPQLPVHRIRFRLLVAFSCTTCDVKNPR